ncbi:23S rRNA (guanosine(2251)-2'-O)-methyltransferase RlmB, partial [Bifidobacterium asteroides]
PISSSVESLNASVAAGISLYTIATARRRPASHTQ